MQKELSTYIFPEIRQHLEFGRLSVNSPKKLPSELSIVIVEFSYVLVFNHKIYRPTSPKAGVWLLSSTSIFIAFYPWLLYSAWCNLFFTFTIKCSRFCNTLGESVVCYNSAFLISMELRVPLWRCGLSSARGLAYHRQSQTGVLPHGR